MNFTGLELKPVEDASETGDMRLAEPSATRIAGGKKKPPPVPVETAVLNPEVQGEAVDPGSVRLQMRKHLDREHTAESNQPP